MKYRLAFFLITFIATSSLMAAPSPDRLDAVVGFDYDLNGVRDDVDSFIRSLPDSELQKKSLEQTAVAFSQIFFTDIANYTSLLQTSKRISDSVSCVHHRYPSTLASKRAMKLEKVYFNTEPRLVIYGNYNSALSGSTSLSPRGNGCLD